MAQSTNDVIPTAIRLGALSSSPPISTARWRRCAMRSLAKGKEFDDIIKSGPHASAGRDADPARPGVHAPTPERSSAESPPPRARGRLSARSRDRRQRRGHGRQRRAGVSGVDGHEHLHAITGLALRERHGPHPAHAEHGRRRRHSAGRCASLASISRKIASDLRLMAIGPAHRPRRDPAARGAARLDHHAGEDESVDPRDGESGRFQVMGIDTTVAMAARSTGSSSST